LEAAVVLVKLTSVEEGVVEPAGKTVRYPLPPFGTAVMLSSAAIGRGCAVTGGTRTRPHKVIAGERTQLCPAIFWVFNLWVLRYEVVCQNLVSTTREEVTGTK
jgi:hypothetical protein